MFALRNLALPMPLSMGLLGICITVLSGVLLLRGDEPTRTGHKRRNASRR